MGLTAETVYYNYRAPESRQTKTWTEERQGNLWPGGYSWTWMSSNQTHKSNWHEQTLLDVILTNQPELFKEYDIFNPEISDHAMVYGLMNEKAIIHQTKTISFIDLERRTVQGQSQQCTLARWWYFWVCWRQTWLLNQLTEHHNGRASTN